MKSVCLMGVFLLLSVAEVKTGTSVSQRSCKSRNLTVMVDDYMWVYFDGVAVNDLQNVIYGVVDFPCTTKLIAIRGENDPKRQVGGIIASTDDDYVLTNSSWKCSNTSQFGWETIDFDDSAWVPAIEYNDDRPECAWQTTPGLSPNAHWIWLRQWNCIVNSTYEEMDMEVYCRKRLVINNCESFPCLNGGTCLNGVNYFVCVCPPESTGVRCETVINTCDPNPCLNGGSCSNLGGSPPTCTCPIFATGVKCESPNYQEAYACGTTLTWTQYEASNGFTRLCYYWTPPEDIVGRNTECRDTIQGIPLYGDYVGLMDAGGNFGCIVAQNDPADLPEASRVACADNYQQDVSLGNYSATDRMMVCIRYPYEGIPGRK